MWQNPSAEELEAALRCGLLYARMRGILHLKVEATVEALLGRLRLGWNPEAALRGELHKLLHAHRALLRLEHLDSRLHQREVLAGPGLAFGFRGSGIRTVLPVIGLRRLFGLWFLRLWFFIF